jgi:hypothetical protein
MRVDLLEEPCARHGPFCSACFGYIYEQRGVKGCYNTWVALECYQQFGENERTAIGKSERLRKVGNARMIKVSAI